MLTGASEYLRLVLAQLVFEGKPWVPPTSMWVALYDSEGNEISAPSYQRQPYIFEKVSDRLGAYRNLTKIEFPTAQEYWGPVAYACVVDAPADGNKLFCASTAPVRVFGLRDQATFHPGELEVNFGKRALAVPA